MCRTKMVKNAKNFAKEPSSFFTTLQTCARSGNRFCNHIALTTHTNTAPWPNSGHTLELKKQAEC